MADWSHETRRYIYRTPDPKWMRMRAGSRALAGELLRWVDDDGALYLRSDEAPWQGVARVIQAHRAEHEWVRRGVKDLLDDGYLTPSPDRITVRNFKVAQGIVESAEALSQRRSKEAERKARWRASRKENQGLGSGSAASVPRDTTGHVHGTETGPDAGLGPGVPGTGSRAPVPAHARRDARAHAPPFPFPTVPFHADQQQRAMGHVPRDTTGHAGGLERAVVEALRVELGERVVEAGDLATLALELLQRARVEREDAPDRLEVIRQAARLGASTGAGLRSLRAYIASKVDELVAPGALEQLAALTQAATSAPTNEPTDEPRKPKFRTSRRSEDW